MTVVVPALGAIPALQAGLSLPLPTGAEPSAVKIAPSATPAARTADPVTLSPGAPLLGSWLMASAALQTLDRVLPVLERTLQQPRSETQPGPLGQLATLVGEAAQKIATFPAGNAPAASSLTLIPPAVPPAARAEPAVARPVFELIPPRPGQPTPPDPTQSATPWATTTPGVSPLRLPTQPATPYAVLAQRADDPAPPSGHVLERWRDTTADVLRTASSLLDRAEQTIEQTTQQLPAPIPNPLQTLPFMPDPMALWALATVAVARRDVASALEGLTPRPRSTGPRGFVGLGESLARLRTPIALIGTLILLLLLWLAAGLWAAVAGLAVAAGACLWIWRVVVSARRLRISPPKRLTRGRSMPP